MEQEVKKKRKSTADDNVAKSINKKAENKKSKKKKNSPLVPILCLIIGILIGIIAAMVFFNKDNGKSDSSTATVEQTDANEAEEVKSTIEEMIESEEAFTIETPYGNLYYPAKWEGQFRVESVEDDNYTVQFYATLEGKEEQHLFDIVYGEVEGVALGTLDETEVYMVYGDISLDGDWTEEEENTIYAMQEDVNYLMGMLQKEEGFVSAN